MYEFEKEYVSTPNEKGEGRIETFVGEMPTRTTWILAAIGCVLCVLMASSFTAAKSNPLLLKPTIILFLIASCFCSSASCWHSGSSMSPW